MMQLVCCNTNKYAKARNLKKGKRKWKDLVVDELYCFFFYFDCDGFSQGSTN